MSRNDRQAFQASLLLHATALLLLGLPILLRLVLPREEPVVFELVSTPAAGEPVPQPAPQPEPQPVDLPDLPEMPPIPEPVPQPPPRPEPEPAPSPRVQSYQDFLRQHGEPEPRQRRQTPRREVEVRPIDTEQIKSQLNALLRESPERERVQQMTLAEQNALAQYVARLKARLDAGWQKPPGLGRQLSCRVVFDVSASGAIRNVRLDPGSGNAAFDASVEAAFRRVPSAGPTPNGEPHSIALQFKMVE